MRTIRTCFRNITASSAILVCLLALLSASVPSAIAQTNQNASFMQQQMAMLEKQLQQLKQLLQQLQQTLARAPIAGGETNTILTNTAAQACAGSTDGTTAECNTSSGPVTYLHFTSGNTFDSNNNYLPGAAGFNLAQIDNVDQLNSLPAGVLGLVYLSLCKGVDSEFISAVWPYIGNEKLFGFYIFDEPDPANCPAAKLKVESDYIHAYVPGAKTFIVSLTRFLSIYSPVNTGIDLFGLDPYPCTRPSYTCSYNDIPDVVHAAEAAGIPVSQIVPVYQAFSGYIYALPSADQMVRLLDTWASVVPNPVFDYAYTWAVLGDDESINTTPYLQTFFLAHNTKSTERALLQPTARP